MKGTNHPAENRSRIQTQLQLNARKAANDEDLSEIEKELSSLQYKYSSARREAPSEISIQAPKHEYSHLETFGNETSERVGKSTCIFSPIPN